MTNEPGLTAATSATGNCPGGQSHDYQYIGEVVTRGKPLGYSGPNGGWINGYERVVEDKLICRRCLRTTLVNRRVEGV